MITYFKSGTDRVQDSEAPASKVDIYSVTMHNGLVTHIRVPDTVSDVDAFIKAESIKFLMQTGLKDYQAKRATEYPHMTDQMDAVMKGGTDFTAMQTTVASVKTANPEKP